MCSSVFATLRKGFRAAAILPGLAGALLLGLVAGCTAPPPVPPETVVAEGGIIAFGPSLTETVFALGHGARVVGMSSFVTHPPEALDRPAVGGMIDPNLERIAALRPAIVLLSGRVPLIEDLGRRTGFVVYDATMDSLAQMEATLPRIGRALGDEAAGHALWQRIASELEAVRAHTAGRPRPSVLLVLSRPGGDLTQVFTAGTASFLHELLVIAGGENLFADATQPYFEASKERIVARAPEVILEFQPGAALEAAATARLVRDWDAMPTLPAVREGRIHVLTEDYLLIPGPRVPQTAQRLAEVLHPTP